MVFYTGKIVIAMNNPTVVILTDLNDLDDQLFATFSASVQLLRQSPKQAGDREQLKELLKVNSGGVIFTTIQKFQPEDGSNVYDTLSERHNIIVIADEVEPYGDFYVGSFLDSEGNKLWFCSLIAAKDTDTG